MTQSIGPPSLAQGTRIAVGFSTSISRFIPAYAGNSCLTSELQSSGSVHPRLRGELAETDDLEEGESRFIPAYAGNSELADKIGFKPAVHPRLRGELAW